MSTDTLAAGSLNSFSGLSAGQVQPEEQIFVLTSAQLEQIISQAVARAQAPLLQEIHALQGRNEALKRELEILQETTARERAYDRQRIARLEAPRITAKVRERAEKIAKYLKERPDHKATLETLKGYLGIKNYLLDDAIHALQADYPNAFFVVERAKTGDKRKKIIRMLPKY